MIEGGVDISLSVAYVPEVEWQQDIIPIGWLKWIFPKAHRRIFGAPTYFDAYIDAINDVEEQVDRHNEINATQFWYREIRVCKNFSELKQAKEDDALAIVHAVEGGHALHGMEAGKTAEDWLYAGEDEVLTEAFVNLIDLKHRGVAYITLAHFYPNILTGCVFPYPEHTRKLSRWQDMLGRWEPNEGLTDIGRKVVQKIFELGMIVDVSHCTPLARSQVYQIADSHGYKCQVIASHAGAYEINADQYNLEDWEIRWISDNGGVVSVILMNYWLVPYETGLGLNHISRTLRHVTKVGGVQVASIGTDFDGFTDPPDDVENMTQLPRITQRLASEYADKGKPVYSDESLEMILGKNSMRVLREGWR